MAITSVGNTRNLGDAPGTTNYSAMAMVTTLFFVWGFCTVLNDAVTPHLKNIFALSYLQASLIQLAFFSSYFIFAQPAGKLIEWIGYKRSMIVGLLTMAAGAILFLPAASFGKYGLFLSAEIVLAAGVTVLQVAANPYVTILGPPETASSRLNLTQAFNTLGDFVAPYIGGIFLLGGVVTAEKGPAPTGQALMAFRIHQAANFKPTYLAIAIIMAVLAIAIGMYKFPRLEVTRDFRPASLDIKQDSMWNHPHLYLGAIAIFVYVGAEVSLGNFAANYFADPTVGNMSLQQGTKVISIYWGLMMVFRFVGSALMQRIAPSKVLAVCGVGAAVLVLCSLLGTGYFAVATFLAIGIFNSIMFPTIFTLGVAELGPLTSRGSGLLVQAIVGGALFPVIMGFLADRIGIHHALVLPFLCYLFVIFYGLRGYRIAPSEAHSQLKTVA
ncbi:sugar MFS transporter [Acidipila sp. EB88]|uniref:sugar MFS transporter n=1 Tax=Acidipila sp. EB88 TaxID=2305226 RepID=UPI000F5F58BB|nr:sugar MFS transporter [Acidipila sp. EB88]RRA47531.1 sugar MFS transporter [Acidipila sp. EB88]